MESTGIIIGERQVWREKIPFGILPHDRLRELGRRLVFYENADALDPHRRSQLGTWLSNRRNGRDGVTAGRTLATAMAEVEQAAADMPDRAAEVEAIRRWLEGGA